MRIFELHFNPKGKEDLIFDSFCYEPENVYEKRLGSLFLVAELKNTLPQNLKFLDKFASFFKKEFYSAPLKSSPESSLKLGLKKANGFLENILKSGDVSWLGNLNMAILSIKNFELNLAKVGAIKILLLRQGQITDVGKNLELEEIEPYPLKIFGKIVSGKLAEGDVILVLTKDVFNFFSGEPKPTEGKFKKTGRTLLKEIAAIQPFDPHTKRGHTSFFGAKGTSPRYGVGVDEKKLKTILKNKEKELLKISGVCLLLYLTKEVWSETQRQKSFTFQQKPEKFSLKKALAPAAKLFKRANAFFPAVLSKVKIFARKRKIEEPKETEAMPAVKKIKLEVKTATNSKFFGWLKIPKVNLRFKKPQINFSSFRDKKFLLEFPAVFKKNAVFVKKNFVLVSCLILFLILGFFIFQKQEQNKLKQFQAVLTSVEKNIAQAENYLALNNEKKAYEILKQALEQVLPVATEKSAVQKEALTLENSIKESLEKISKLEKIQDPKLLFEFNEKEFIPQEMVFLGDSLYFFSLLAKNVYQVNLAGQKNVLPADQAFNEAVVSGDQILFFQKPNLIFFLRNGQWSQPLSLSLPYPDFNLKTLATYHANLYLLDAKSGEITKYASPLAQNKDLPQAWLAKSTQKIIGAKAIAIDGPVWILNQNNTISQYYTGALRKTIELDLYPEPQSLASFTAAFGLFYILEPAQRRLIIMTESGSVVKQWQSDKFDNLKDFAVSGDGRTVWVLNGAKIFEVSF